MVGKQEAVIINNKIVKHVNINENEESIDESTNLRNDSPTSKTCVDNLTASENFVKLTGTITRGKKKGQNVDIVLNISREELEIMESDIQYKKDLNGNNLCTKKSGVHILLWSILCVPFIKIISFFYSFYMGTLTWYNIFSFFSEEKPIVYKIFVTPFLILSYPFLIVLLSLGFSIYSCIIQISWFWESWVKQVGDFEKGFFGWLCNVLNLPDCAPYEVIILSNSSPQEI